MLMAQKHERAEVDSRVIKRYSQDTVPYLLNKINILQYNDGT